MMRTASAQLLDRAFVVESVEREFAQTAKKSILSKVCSGFGAGTRALLFGGVIRNAVLSAMLHKPFPRRDTNFVVFGMGSDEDLSEALEPLHPHRNSFGGLKIEVDGATIDVWRAELQRLVAGQPPVVTSFDEFLRCVTLTTDAVLYDIAQGTIYEEGFIYALRTQTIDLGANSRWVEPWIHYHLAHLAYVRALTGFALSPRAREAARNALTGPFIEQAVAYLASRRKCDDPREVVLALQHEAHL